MEIREGFYIQLVNRATSRVLFSAATDELTQEAFMRLWSAVGESIHKGLVKDSGQANYYELRAEPITGHD